MAGKGEQWHTKEEEDAKEMKSIQLHDSIEGLSQR